MAMRLRLRAISDFSHQMSTMLEAGLPIRRALATAERGARSSRRQLYGRLGREIEGGATFSEALEHQGRTFPPLYRRLVHVGETVGGLGGVLKRLSEYYGLLRSMWTRMLLRLIYPAFLYVFLVLVIAFIAYLPAWLQNDPVAAYKALRVLVIGVAIFFIPFILYYAITRLLGGLRPTHEVMTRFPIIGRVFRTLTLARFSWCMELMTDAGVRITDAVTWSLQASGNAAYAARAPKIVSQLEAGNSLSEALSRTGLFPYDYLEMLHIAEESGSMPDIFRRQAKDYFERAEVSLKMITSAVFWTAWGIMAIIIIVFYVRTILGFYSTILSE